MSCILLVAVLLLVFIGARNAASLAMGKLQQLKGNGHDVSLEEVLRDRSLSLMLFLALSCVVSAATVPWAFVPCAVTALILSREAPGLLDRQRAQRRCRDCETQLDAMADIVAMGVRAGLSFDAALDMYCAKFSNELSTSLGNARVRWKSGMASRERALEDLSSELGSRLFARFSETVLRAIRFGSPLAGMLSTLADDLRQMKHDAIERQVAKAPVKMLIPTGTCILPAMLILVMGPVLLQFVQSGF